MGEYLLRKIYGAALATIDGIIRDPMEKIAERLREAGDGVIRDAEKIRAGGVAIDVARVRAKVDETYGANVEAIAESLRLELVAQLFEVKKVSAAAFERTRSEGAAKRAIHSVR